VSPVAKSDKAVLTLARLCARVGCPWDRKQTFDIIRRYTLEETCEVLWQQTFIAIAMNLVLKS